MLEKIKEIQDETLVHFNNEEIIDITGSEQMETISVKSCVSDDGEFVFLELDEVYLVAHDFDVEPKYFIYQILTSGQPEDLEEDGFHFLTEDEDFRNKIVYRDESRTHIYKHSEIGAIYDMTEDVSLCEYTSNSHELNHILIVKKDELLVLQGVEIFPEDFTIDGVS